MQMVQPRKPHVQRILKVLRLPPQSIFWRFLASPPLSMAGPVLRIQPVLRQRVWKAAHIQLKVVTIDADATVHTVFQDLLHHNRFMAERTRPRGGGDGSPCLMPSSRLL